MAPQDIGRLSFLLALFFLLQNHANLAIAKHVREITLSLSETEIALRDPNNASVSVLFKTRAYNGSIPGPIIKTRPGETLRIRVVNDLPSSKKGRLLETIPCTPSNCTTLHGKDFHDSNTTNLHTHGLHVSPRFGSDDVLDVEIPPGGGSFVHEYEIPSFHEPGTFWYHPHFEGSTAQQVGGGAAGALIVEREEEEDDDILLFVQQIPFSALVGLQTYSDGSVFRVKSDTLLPNGWRNDEKVNNQHDGPPFEGRKIDNVGLVNGKFKPNVATLRSGSWSDCVRIVNAGAMFFMDLTLEEDGTTSEPERCEIKLLAIDGIDLQDGDRFVDRIVLPPGGRADVRFRCFATGSFVFKSGARTGTSQAYSSDLYWNPFLATVRVDNTASASSKTLRRESKERSRRATYLKDLRHVTETSKFNFTFQDVTLTTNDTSATAKILYPRNGDTGGTCTFNKQTFEAGSPLRTMSLGTVEEWRVRGVQGHPLHLHVNPMQIVAFLNASDGSVDDTRQCDEEYGYLCVGDWIDTLQLPTGNAGSTGALVRFHVADFIGHDVVHCHYLPHEDQGCITYAEVVVGT